MNLYFNPNEYLLGMLLKAVARKKDVIFTLPGTGQLVVLVNAGEYHTDIKDMKGLCTVSKNEIHVRELKNREKMELGIEYKVGRNIDELMWKAGYFASNGRLMEGLKTSDIVHIKQWPNLTRLPNNYSTFQMTAMFKRHPTTIIFAQRVLKVSEEEIYSYYTAAHCAGITETLNSAPAEKRHSNNVTKEEGTLLNRILGRIANL